MSAGRQQPAAAGPERITSIWHMENTILQIAALYFGPGRPAHSAAYRDGFAAALRLLALRRRPAVPFAEGTAEADAWFAGAEAAKAVWHDELQNKQSSRMAMQ